MTMNCFILSGVPGAGKSYIAKDLAERYGAIICSADSYFIDTVTGKYNFDYKMLGEAHGRCKSKAFANMYAQNNIIIDNTNLSVKDMKPYVKMAEHFGYKTTIVRPNNWWSTEPNELFIRNTHGVPFESIMKMLDKYKHTVSNDILIEDMVYMRISDCNIEIINMPEWNGLPCTIKL